MVGRTPSMRAAFAALQRAAEGDSPVLLSGEVGSGKELAAETVHRRSARRARPFVIVDCTSDDEELETELFGRVEPGALERAAGGTVFLDEIGELSLELQPKLLRAVERRQIKRIDGMGFVGIDVRIVAGTRLDLSREVEAGRFRPDLYYRIAVIDVHLPPLRARLDDVPLLVDCFLARAGAASRPEADRIRASARQDLARYAWPGNVRELESWLLRCLSVSRVVPPEPALQPRERDGAPLRLRDARKRWIEEFEQRYLRDALERHRDNVSAAARAAGVDRKYFHRLLVKHGLR
jgi:DNA-binding NtrC family response regulator